MYLVLDWLYKCSPKASAADGPPPTNTLKAKALLLINDHYAFVESLITWIENPWNVFQLQTPMNGLEQQSGKQEGNPESPTQHCYVNREPNQRPLKYEGVLTIPP